MSSQPDSRPGNGAPRPAPTTSISDPPPRAPTTWRPMKPFAPRTTASVTQDPGSSTDLSLANSELARS